MAQLLQRLGRTSFRRRRLVLTAWIGLFAVLAGIALSAGGSFITDFSIPGTESQKANDLLGQRVPAAQGATGRVVVAAPEGEQLTGHSRDEVRSLLATIADGPGIADVSDPFVQDTVSADGRIVYAQIVFDEPRSELDASEREPIAAAAENANEAGLEVGVTGDAAPQTESEGGAGGVLGIAIAFVVLAITFGAIVAAGMPLLTAVVGVGLGLTGIVAASAVFELSSAVISLAAMLGLAVGIDYALLIISRYRSLAQGGMALDEAAGRATGTAGTAVVFAGSTVVIALVALVVTGVPFMVAMGLAAAATVAIAVMVAITLVPALLGFAGARGIKGKRFGVADPQTQTMGVRWGDYVMRHRVATIGLITVTTLALAVPATHLRIGLPGDASKPIGDVARTGSDLLSQGFGEGFNGQLTVLALAPQGGDAKTAAAAVSDRLKQLDDVASVAPAQLTPDGSLAIISVTPESGPSSVATKDLVATIREDRQRITAGFDIDLSVTGRTAIDIDVADRMSSAMLPYLAVIVVLAFLLLMIAFRSLLVPLTAVAGFLLSVAAAMGAMVAVFQDGFGADMIGVSQTAPIVSLIPILTIGILFGLAMDYQVFLVSRMREARAHGADPQDAIRQGFSHSARVVTAAGLIMISVFAAFILPDDAIVKSIGFALTVGVLIDAFLIRMTLIPALMSLLGERAWWLPQWVDHLIPNVDLEGANLQGEVDRHDSIAAIAAGT